MLNEILCNANKILDDFNKHLKEKITEREIGRPLRLTLCTISSKNDLFKSMIQCESELFDCYKRHKHLNKKSYEQFREDLKHEIRKLEIEVEKRLNKKIYSTDDHLPINLLSSEDNESLAFLTSYNICRDIPYDSSNYHIYKDVLIAEKQKQLNDNRSLVFDKMLCHLVFSSKENFTEQSIQKYSHILESAYSGDERYDFLGVFYRYIDALDRGVEGLCKFNIQLHILNYFMTDDRNDVVLKLQIDIEKEEAKITSSKPDISDDWFLDKLCLMCDAQTVMNNLSCLNELVDLRQTNNKLACRK